MERPKARRMAPITSRIGIASRLAQRFITTSARNALNCYSSSSRFLLQIRHNVPKTMSRSTISHSMTKHASTYESTGEVRVPRPQEYYLTGPPGVPNDREVSNTNDWQPQTPRVIMRPIEGALLCAICGGPTVDGKCQSYEIRMMEERCPSTE